MKKQSMFVFFKLGVQTGSLETWEGNFHANAAGVLINLSWVTIHSLVLFVVFKSELATLRVILACIFKGIKQKKYGKKQFSQ